VWLAAHAALWPLLPAVPQVVLAPATPQGLGFTPDGRSLITCDDVEVCVWDIATGRRERALRRPAAHADAPRGMVIAPASRHVIVYDDERDAPHLIDLDTGRTTSLPSFGDEPVVEGDGRAGRWNGTQTAVWFSPDGRTILQSAYLPDLGHCSVRLWDIPTGTERLIPVPRLFSDCTISADGRVAVALYSPWPSERHSFQILDLAAARPRNVVPIPLQAFDSSPVMWSGFAPDGRTWAVSGRGSEGDRPLTQVWDMASGQPVVTLDGWCAGWNADGRLVLYDTDYAKLIDITSGEEVIRWPAPRFGDVCVVSDGRILSWSEVYFLPEAVRRFSTGILGYRPLPIGTGKWTPCTTPAQAHTLERSTRIMAT
jgi:WD40 repeat protein